MITTGSLTQCRVSYLKKRVKRLVTRQEIKKVRIGTAMGNKDGCGEELEWSN